MHAGRSCSGSGSGLHGRENAGISSEREARNLPVESLRFPGEGSSAQGKLDNGLKFPYHRQTLYEAVTQRDSSSARMEKCVQGEALADSEVRLSQSVALTGSGQEKRSE